MRRVAVAVIAFGCHTTSIVGNGPDAGAQGFDAAAAAVDASPDAMKATDGAPRLLGPLSTTTTALHRPQLHWVGGAGAPAVDLCADRACTRPLAITVELGADGHSAQPVDDLSAGWTFWRVRDSGETSATWQLWIGAGARTIFDVNGDGYPDILVGAPGTDRAHIFLGGADGISSTGLDILSPDGSGTCTNGGNCFGQALIDAGDLDGDGFSDFVIGASAYNNDVGIAHVYFGGAAADVSTWNGASPTRRLDLASPTGSTYGFFGELMGPVGDLDGDGYGEFAIAKAAFGASPAFAYVYRGGAATTASDWNGTTAMRRLDLDEPETTGHSFWVPAALGDINGDGFADFAVPSMPSESDYMTSYVHVYLGEASLSTARYNGATAAMRVDLATPYMTEQFGGEFGDGLAGVGDVDGDGYPDFVIAAPWHDIGSAQLFRGNPEPSAADWQADGSPHRIEIACPTDDDFFGLVVSGIGDVNGDGLADFAISGGADFTLDRDGAAHIFFGNPVAANASWNGDGATERIDLPSVGGANTQFGYALAPLGDLDGDGFLDFGVGTAVGAAYIYFGSAAPTDAAWNGASPTRRADLPNPDGPSSLFGQTFH